MANQKDVARRAGVSSATVSRYLTDPNQVKSDSASKIQAAIEELDYRLDLFARGLKTGRNYHVGILLPGNGPFYWEILQSIEDKLTRAGFYINIFYTRNVDKSLNSSRDRLTIFLNNKLIEGVIFFPLLSESDEELYQKLVRMHEHVVIVDRDLNKAQIDQITIDTYRAGYQAAEEFYKRGHREFLYIGGMENSYSAQQRKAGFIDGLQSFGITMSNKREIKGDFTSCTAFNEANIFLENAPKFSAVFAASDATAIGFMRAAANRGITCPRDYSIIGFDNNLEFTPYMTPSLSTFKQPLNEVGTIAAERLIQRMNTNSVPQQIVLQTEFIPRESLTNFNPDYSG